MGKPINDPNRISMTEAAHRLGMTPESLRHCIANNVLPISIGVAFKKPGAVNTTYYVYRSAVEKLEQIWGLVD